MKVFVSVIIGVFLASVAYGNDRPTIDSLIGEEIVMETGWTGCSFTLWKTRDGAYTVLWRDFGSGVAVINEERFKVQVRSDYQFLFKLKSKKKVNVMVVSMGDQGEFKVYVDGFRVHAKKESDRFR